MAAPNKSSARLTSLNAWVPALILGRNMRRRREMAEASTGLVSDPIAAQSCRSVAGEPGRSRKVQMKLHVRLAMALSVLTITLSVSAAAQDYPGSRPIRIIVPYGPGEIGRAHV